MPLSPGSYKSIVNIEAIRDRFEGVFREAMERGGAQSRDLVGLEMTEFPGGRVSGQIPRLRSG
jgi:hypothetical protein